MSETEILKGCYKVSRCIGGGQQGNIILVTDENNNLKAIKQIHITGNPKKFVEENPELLLANLNHNNIIKYYEYFTDKHFLNVVFEYCECGDLQDYIDKLKDNRKIIDSDLLLEWFKQITFGLNYLHDNNCHHRDLKPGNILIKNNQLKIGDFGVSKILLKNGTISEIGTPVYWPPQLFKREKYTLKSDVWALGVILHEMCTNEMPFKGHPIDILMQSVLNDQTPLLNKFSCFDNLLSRMLQKEETHRADIKEVIRIIALFVSENNVVYRASDLLEKKLKQIVEKKQTIMICLIASDIKDIESIVAILRFIFTERIKFSFILKSNSGDLRYKDFYKIETDELKNIELIQKGIIDAYECAHKCIEWDIGKLLLINFTEYDYESNFIKKLRNNMGINLFQININIFEKILNKIVSQIK